MEFVERAWNALSDYVDEKGRVSDIRVGTGQSQDVNYYLNHPRMAGDLHGQAPCSGSPMAFWQILISGLHLHAHRPEET